MHPTLRQAPPSDSRSTSGDLGDPGVRHAAQRHTRPATADYEEVDRGGDLSYDHASGPIHSGPDKEAQGLGQVVDDRALERLEQVAVNQAVVGTEHEGEHRTDHYGSVDDGRPVGDPAHAEDGRLARAG